MSQNNTGTIVCDFRNARGNPIRGEVEFGFRNLKIQSLNFRHRTVLSDEPLRLAGVPAFPTGLWQIDINIKRFRFKSVFVDLPSNGERAIHETFFINPSEAAPSFPSTDEIRTVPKWRALAAALTPAQYQQLEPHEKAGVLNLFAKMSHPSTPDVFGDVIDVFKVKPARIFARVKPQLWQRVRELPQRFQEQPDGGSLHEFLENWTRFAEHASFKTPDAMGNLQLTFASNPQEEFAVDADLDDHRGLQHAFDVIKHKFSGDTNPYDIHEVLVKFQGIDPGYDLY
jgi:hypothetical protein